MYWGPVSDEASSFGVFGAQRSSGLREIEDLGGQPRRGVAAGAPRIFRDFDIRADEIEHVDAVSFGVEDRLERGHHQRRVGRGDDLARRSGGRALEQLACDGQQGWQQGPLPPRMQVRFEFVDEEEDPVFGGLVEKLRGQKMFLPGPDEEVGQRDDSLHASGGQGEGDVAVGSLEGGDVSNVVDPYAGGLGRLEDPLLSGGESAQDLAELCEGRLMAPLPADPVADDAIG